MLWFICIAAHTPFRLYMSKKLYETYQRILEIHIEKVDFNEEEKDEVELELDDKNEQDLIANNYNDRIKFFEFVLEDTKNRNLFHNRLLPVTFAFNVIELTGLLALAIFNNILNIGQYLCF